MAFTARTETYFNASTLSDPFDATVNKPSGTAEGDILFAILCWNTATIDSVPTGWTLLGDFTVNIDKHALYYKVAGASEPSSYTWSFSASFKVRIVCSCYTAGDFNASSPIDVVSNTAYRTSDAIVRAAAMSVANPNSPLVFWASIYSTATKSFTKPTSPGTWIEDDDTWDTLPDFGNEVCSQIWSGSGNTGAMDATCSATLTAKHAFAVALNLPSEEVPKSSQQSYPLGWTPDKALEAAISSQANYPLGWTPGKALDAALSSEKNYPLGWTPARALDAALSSEKNYPLGWSSESSVAPVVPKLSEQNYPLGWIPARALDAALSSATNYPLGWTPGKALDAALSSEKTWPLGWTPGKAIDAALTSQKDYSPGWASESSREIQGEGTPKQSQANWPLGWTSHSSKANIVWKGLSDTLLAAQKKPHRIPYVEAKVYDYEQGIKRLSWTSLYTGSEPGNHHGIAFDGQGSMYRIRSGGSSTLLYQKIISPGPSSDFSNWSLITNDCYGPCAIAACGAKVYIFYRTTGNVLWKYYSHDYGQSWNNAQLIAVATVLSMAASWKGTTSTVVCFAATPFKISAMVLDTTDQTTAEHYYNHALDTIYGIGATFRDGEFPILFAASVTVGATVLYALYATRLDATFAFLSPYPLLTAHDDQDTIFTFPDCHSPLNPEPYETLQLTAVESYSGITSYNRPLFSRLVKGTYWSDATIIEPRFFLPLTSAFGLRLITDSSHWWLSMPGGLWRASRQADSPVDLTPYIIRIRQLVGAGLVPALTIELDNSRAHFSTPPPNGSEIVLKLGYKTTAGPESVNAGHYWIDSSRFTSSDNTSVLIISATDLWGLAARWSARYVLRWNYTSPPVPCRVWAILYQILGRFGIRLWNNGAVPQSDPMNNFYPKYLVRGGSQGHTQVRRLLSFVTDGLIQREAFAFVKDLLSTESPCYEYRNAPGYHPLLKGEYDANLTITHTQVSGDTEATPPVHVREAAFDWPLLSLGIDNLAMQYDPNLEEADQAQKRADALLRHEAQKSLGGQIIVPTNCGQELYDVVKVTDTRVGLANKNFRVLAIQTDYSRRKALYEQKLTLGAP